MEKAIKKGLTVTTCLISHQADSKYSRNTYITECRLKFSDGSILDYECEDIEELENEPRGIYELNEDGTFTQRENWETLETFWEEGQSFE